MTTTHYADGSGNYIGGFGEGVTPPIGGVATNTPPATVRDVWNGAAWVAAEPLPAQEVPKWRLERALKLTVFLTTDPQNPIWRNRQPQDVAGAFQVIRNASWSQTQDTSAREEYETIAVFYRDPARADYWPYLWAGIRSLCPNDTVANAYMDFIFNKAANV